MTSTIEIPFLKHSLQKGETFQVDPRKQYFSSTSTSFGQHLQNSISTHETSFDLIPQYKRKLKELNNELEHLMDLSNQGGDEYEKLIANSNFDAVSEQ